MFNKTDLNIIGYACDNGGPTFGSSEGPAHMQESKYLKELHNSGLRYKWLKIIEQESSTKKDDQIILSQCTRLANEVASLVDKDKFFLVLGGDHCSAIGTWSGAHDKLAKNSEMGLIWIDAHMDSHTDATSATGNIHGMPLASLLGKGNKSLNSILSKYPKILPHNICLIGIRSYEPEELELLTSLNVKIFYMDEVKEKGFKECLKQALSIVKKNTEFFGVSIDIDAIDPLDAPGTDVKENDGIKKTDILNGLELLNLESSFIGFEIVEFDPKEDKNNTTEKLVAEMISKITLGF